MELYYFTACAKKNSWIGRYNASLSSTSLFCFVVSGSTPEFYPLQCMETGSDILFFWVARMAMLCQELAPADTRADTPATASRSGYERTMRASCVVC